MPVLSTIHALLVASSEGGHGHGTQVLTIDSVHWGEVGAVILSAIIFFGFIAYKVRPAVRDGLLKRRSTLEEQLQEAQKKAAEAQARAAEYKDKLAHLEEEVQRIADNYKAEAEREAARMEQETEAAISRLARESDNTIRQEILKAEQRIHAAAVETTLSVAERLVQERITPADQRQLVDQYISELKERAPSA